ncbi:MAG: Hsp20/alpha crystallin family protein [Deltaproteobacteria bacterium]|nr:Hsp20/alpha crystallin family protein [Deltaproteobacteria bacterium]
METKHPAIQPSRLPGRGIWSVHEAIDRLFDNLMRGFEIEPLEPWRVGMEGLVSVDVSETDREVVIAADLPGMDKEDLDVTVTRDRLIIKGEKKEEREEKNKGYFRKERFFGTVYREIPLPCEVLTDKAGAEFKKGVLYISLPKSSEVLRETRRIPIKAAA